MPDNKPKLHGAAGFLLPVSFFVVVIDVFAAIEALRGGGGNPLPAGGALPLMLLVGRLRSSPDQVLPAATCPQRAAAGTSITYARLLSQATPSSEPSGLKARLKMPPRAPPGVLVEKTLLPLATSQIAISPL